MHTLPTSGVCGCSRPKEHHRALRRIEAGFMAQIVCTHARSVKPFAHGPHKHLVPLDASKCTPMSPPQPAVQQTLSESPLTTGKHRVHSSVGKSTSSAQCSTCKPPSTFRNWWIYAQSDDLTRPRKKLVFTPHGQNLEKATLQELLLVRATNR